MGHHNGSENGRILILIAPGFEEGATVLCLERLREAGLPVSLIGLSAGLLTGLHGLTVRPDYSLDQLSLTVPRRLIVVSGGRQSAASLLSDPRVHQLLNATLEASGYAAAMSSAETCLAQAGIPVPSYSSRFIAQSNIELDGFIHRLINIALS